MSAVLTNENELRLAPGGPTLRLIRRIGVARRLGIGGEGGRATAKRVVGLLLVTWVPMCVLAILQGRALGATPRDSFLLDFATHARFFVGLPTLVAAEVTVGSRLRRAGLEFLRQGFVRGEELAVFERAIARVARRREAVLPLIIIVALAFFGAGRFTVETATGAGTSGWRSMTFTDGHALHYSFAAIWNSFVAVPIFLILLYRWLWRILIWALFLFDVARMNLRLVPTHSDGAAGIGFLEVAHMSFASLAFATGTVLSAEAAFRIVYEGAHLDTFQTPLIILLVVTEILFLGPLVVFAPALARARRAALITYGALLVEYDRRFAEKWIDSPRRTDEPLLGSSDIQSLADLGNGFRFVREMRVAPFGRRAVLQLALAAAAPGLPLLLLVVPLREIVETLAKVAL